MKQLTFLPRRSAWQRFMAIIARRSDLILPPPDRSTQRQAEIFDRQDRMMKKMERQG